MGSINNWIRSSRNSLDHDSLHLLSPQTERLRHPGCVENGCCTRAPGEVLKEISFGCGQKIRICGSLPIIRREEFGVREREICPPAHEFPNYIHYHQVNCDLLRIDRSTRFHIIKPGHVEVTSHKVIVPMSQYDAECVIEDVCALEQSYAFGIGRKRIFGLGFPCCCMYGRANGS